MIPATDDGRVLFAVPWHSHVVVGTTDTPVDRIDLEPRALEEEIEFLLRTAARYLTRDPQRSDVESVFAGLRPLVSVGADDPAQTASISREHTVLVSASGLVTIAGGKWTTYRKMGADVIDEAAPVGGLELRASETESLRLHGWTETGGGDPWRVYGSEAEEVRTLSESRPRYEAVLHERLPYRAGQVVWAARHEMARTVEDVLARRTRALFLDARAAMEAAPAVAAILAEELGRDAAWVDDQVEEFRNLAKGYLLA
jgi:glycerol-3-phosphate dehydrogenase